MKSHVNDLLILAECLLRDTLSSSTVRHSHRDLCTIKSRVKEEGISFLTITLPNFARDFEKSLEQGYIDSECFRMFRKHKTIPVFLQGMLSQVFDQETGRIIDDIELTSPPRVSSIVRDIRQICLMFKKIKIECAPWRNSDAIEGFIATEHSFNEFHLSAEELAYFSLVSSVLWDDMLGAIRTDMFVPKHGPGNTADRLLGNSKYDMRRWHDRLEPYFPFIDTLYPISWREWVDKGGSDSLTVVPADEEQPSRVTLVPKTLKSPRIIAIEPCCMQYTQQAVAEVLTDLIERNYITSGHINFRDQRVNQLLAIKSSSDGQLATIDLSDASDRVPLSLVEVMLGSNRDLLGAVLACRSTSAQLPNGDLISPLKKFASMGSALCFPIESMYFFTLCVMGLLEAQNLPVSRANILHVSRCLYLFGDDILVPSHSTVTVLDYLRRYNCKVNTTKTFHRGSFRESCGVDAFLGFRVSPVYLRTLPPESRQQSSELLSWTSTARQCFSAGRFWTSQYLFKKVERYLGLLPTTDDRSPAIGRNHYYAGNNRLRRRYNRRTQCLEVRTWVPSPVYYTDTLEGYGALQKFFLSSHRNDGHTGCKPWWESILQVAEDHLERSARFASVALKRRWVPYTQIG